jgi:hypothetical protein
MEDPHMPSHDEWTRLVNSKWPSDIPIPSDKEAITGAKRLYRKAMGRPFRGKVVVTSGNRYSWIRSGVMSVNPKRRNAWQPQAGWPDIVHLLSHYFHRRLYPRDKPHSHRQLDLEAELTRYVVENGFHEGRLKRKTKEKPKLSRKEKGHQAALAALARWETKLRRAETGVKKYRAKVRYYEKVMKDVPQENESGRIGT